jgi:cell division GTPase FtsZ
MDDLFPEEPIKVKFFGCGDIVNKNFQKMIPDKYRNIEVINTFSNKQIYDEVNNSDLENKSSTVKRIYFPIEKTVSIADLSCGMKEIRESIEDAELAVFVFDFQDRASIEQVNLLTKMCRERNILVVGAALVPDYRVIPEKQVSIFSRIDKFKSKFNTLITLECEKLKNDLEKDNYILENDFLEQSMLYLLEGLWDLFDTIANSNTKEELGQFFKRNKTASLAVVEAEGENKFEDVVRLLLKNKYYGINKMKTQKLISTIVIDNMSTLDEVKKALEQLALETQDIDIVFTVMQEEEREDFVKFIALSIN